jgi:hypothetical protein
MTNIKFKLIALCTAIAMFALPIADASARYLGHYW